MSLPHAAQGLAGRLDLLPLKHFVISTPPRHAPIACGAVIVEVARSVATCAAIPPLSPSSPDAGYLQQLPGKHDIATLTQQDIDGWLLEAVPPMRQAINIIETMLDVECIVVGGFLPEPILTCLLAALPPLHISVRSGYSQQERLLKGSSGVDTAALGAAALPIFDEFNPQYDVLLKPHTT